MKILDKLFYMTHKFWVNHNAEDDGIPILTIGCIAVLLSFNILLILLILDDFFGFSSLMLAGDNIFLEVIGLILILALYYFPKKRYKRIYESYDSKGSDYFTKNEMGFWLYVGLSLLIPLAMTVIFRIILR